MHLRADRPTRTPGRATLVRKHAAQIGLLAAALSAMAACEPELTIGRWTCSRDGAQDSIPDRAGPIAVPWSTGFEDRFCDYTQLAGFCYAGAGASYELVTSPVRSGNYAAAFSVASDEPSAVQARCVREGVLPSAAYYGAWYFIPAFATNTSVWNLFHFQGRDASAPMLHGLWDVSLVNAPNDGLRLVLFDFLNGVVRAARDTPPVPIGTWFHLQLYLKRSADRTGEVALYQDGIRVFAVENITTDDSDLGQWYVGNYADGLMPADSTLYVDDVTISATL
jgi:hypothetical protein